ncbi:4-hydroxythreonine-4-phosphate dehydrogenase PdxA [Desulfitobacterium sp. THU1]|uniref:4-hydroxythreonine-4-phosphate dehydrogenase PdxA n=1 Tax=Desulfitobacterium sp. THU1 TaxID=3138072 RepID=UPI00311FDFD9
MINSEMKPVIGITMGDPAGIGPEIVAKAAAAGILDRDARSIIVGDQRLFKYGMQIARVNVDFQVASTLDEALRMKGIVVLDTKRFNPADLVMGELSADCGKDAATNLQTCVEYCRQGLMDGLCFAPNNKAAMKKAGFVLQGAIDLLAGFFQYEGNRGELNVLDDVWTARVTSHIPVKEISAQLSEERILRSIHLVNKTLKRAGIAHPHIAVAALNPHGGEDGTCGREEIEIISPAIEGARALGIKAEGPFPADTLFIKLFNKEYHAAVTMFHDQGQIAMKLKGFDQGVTVMAGLPIPVTTCSHGSAFDIAGQGIASPGAWESAYELVVKMAEMDRQHRC